MADAPSPREAAAVLKALAKRAMRLPPALRSAALLRHRVVLGLVECLRAVLPRPPVSSKLPASPSGQPALPLSAHSEALSAAELSGAIWALAVLGDSLMFEVEMDALLDRLPGLRFTRLLQVRW